MHTRESITKETKRIQNSIPQRIKDNTLIETYKSPDIVFVLKKALEDPSISEEKKTKIRSLLESNHPVVKKEIRENARIAKIRDDYVQREIKKAVKAGRLPTKKQLAKLKLNELHGEEEIHTGVEGDNTEEGLGKRDTNSDEKSGEKS